MKKIFKIIVIAVISIFIILFLEIAREIHYLNKNVFTDGDEKANKEIEKAIENMPKEQRILYDSLTKSQFNDTIK
ncbi:MAG: hypothetical protein H6Q16_1173 [Bacteroidetes bacterium]|nr:hypothetical protein [Bacteroidota bacterium]